THTHNISDVNELKEKLDDKADSKWIAGYVDATKEYIFAWTEGTYAQKYHRHNISDVNELQEKLYDIVLLRQELNVLKQNLPNLIYPVGSLYVSMNSTRPEVVLGVGTWTQIVDRFLYCANSSKETGGSKTISGENLPAHSHYVDLTTSEAGWHKHRYWDWTGMIKGKGYDVKDEVKFAINCYWDDTQAGGSHTHRVTGYTQTTGQSKEYMPPYMTVYAWYRIA
ncbi:tail fiber protein, putative, partial [Trichomonas vaginalis G3]